MCVPRFNFKSICVNCAIDNLYLWGVARFFFLFDCQSSRCFNWVNFDANALLIQAIQCAWAYRMFGMFNILLRFFCGSRETKVRKKAIFDYDICNSNDFLFDRGFTSWAHAHTRLGTHTTHYTAIRNRIRAFFRTYSLHAAHAVLIDRFGTRWGY